MHARDARVAQSSLGRRRLRIVGVAWCVIAVVLGHGLVWLMVSSPGAQPGARAAAVQVRQIVVPAERAPMLRVPDASPARDVRVAGPPRADSQNPPRPRTPARAAPSAERATAHEANSESDPAPTAPIAAAPAGTSPTPIYPTRIPPSTRLHFRLQRGAAIGEASLHWRVDGAGYELELLASMPQGRTVEQRSQGGFDDAGLAPLRLADRRRGRDVRAANFQREHGKISFSGPRVEWPLFGGAQDRLSWLVQLVAIASAPGSMREGAEVSMWVAGARGAFGIWRFEVRGRESLATAGGDALVWRLVREPAHPYDMRLEVWLDPARDHWPLRMRQTQVPGGEPLEWTLRDAVPAAPRS
jgi:hypothetical protein